MAEIPFQFIHRNCCDDLSRKLLELALQHWIENKLDSHWVYGQFMVIFASEKLMISGLWTCEVFLKTLLKYLKSKLIRKQFTVFINALETFTWSIQIPSISWAENRILKSLGA